MTRSGQVPLAFRDFFTQATGIRTGPYRYQERLAEGGGGAGKTGPHCFPDLLDVPTGLGKTAAVVLAWLWRRRFHPDEEVRSQTPRRLAYCLPMRVLVEQTYENAVRWLARLGVLAGDAAWRDPDALEGLEEYKPEPGRTTLPEGWARSQGHSDSPIAVHLLMGGEERTDWALWPERDAILVGTQDMLLSRALNRGYGASRYRWPLEYGLLHTDCLWVFDEVQLMDVAVATSAQLEAFRRKLDGNPSTETIWMSATLDPEWLNTVDFEPDWLADPVALGESDLALPTVKARYTATKPIERAKARLDDHAACAEEILAAHKPGTLTLAVFNTVDRAVRVHKALSKKAANVLLIHSRFRPPDREAIIRKLLAKPPAEGTIAVATQVVEAGVDVSARVLFTDLAPWASLVQRFGRCNRRGEYSAADGPKVVWFDIESVEEFRAARQDKYKGKKAADVTAAYEKQQQKWALPYEWSDLAQAREQLLKLASASPAELSKAEVRMRLELDHVIRRRDFIDLFDTTPDLAGNDIDVSRFIRSGDDLDVQVFWREVPGVAPEPEKEGKPPRREELCAVPVGDFRNFVDKRAMKDGRRVWRWDPLEHRWSPTNRDSIYPGQTFLIDSRLGGYSPETGWDSGSKVSVPVIGPAAGSGDSYDGDPYARSPGVWMAIAEHADELVETLEEILERLALDPDLRETLRLAARWHDRGKAHPVFQAAIKDRPPQWAERTDVAKAPDSHWNRGYERPHFRHELASALALLQHGGPDLAVYLAGAHHGKVRLSIRSLPGEKTPEGESGRLFARGVWDGDELPETDLGAGVVAPAVKLSLEPMQLGRSSDGKPSWAERMLRLRDRLGPFRLAFLEALLRAADMRASRPKEQQS